MCVLSCFSHVRPFATPWTVARQAPLTLGFPSQENWSGLPLPSPGALPILGIKPTSFMSPALAGGFVITALPGKPHYDFSLIALFYIKFSINFDNYNSKQLLSIAIGYLA